VPAGGHLLTGNRTIREGTEERNVVADPVLVLAGISKRFGSVQALSNVDLEVRAGEVVALVGDNGAGKSTLAKVIAGVDPSDSGEIRWEGTPVSISKPHDATALGIATVYQDLSLCDNLDVVANLFLGNEKVAFGMLDEIGMERTARELLSSLSVTIPSLKVPIATLSGGQRQSVAIARSLLAHRGAGRGADRARTRPHREAGRPGAQRDLDQP
jgi:D-xylose transport system ATP-binding protein